MFVEDKIENNSKSSSSCSMSNDSLDIPLKEEPTITTSLVKEALDKPIHTHIRWSGLTRTHLKVIAKDIVALARCATINDITFMMYSLRSRWENNGIFSKVSYNLEPTANGNADDVCVHIEVEESKPKKTFGVFTTDTAIPEIQVELSHILGGRYSIRGNYIPPASRLHSAAMTICSNVPAIGQQAEYAVERRTECKHDHLASAENISEVRATTTLHSTANYTAQLTAGLQRRTFTRCDEACRGIETSLLDDLLRSSDKGYIRHECHFANASYHAHPVLYNMYPLPITGWQVYLSNELATRWLGGDVNFLKSEIQATRYWPLGPFCSLQWSFRIAGISGYQRVKTSNSNNNNNNVHNAYNANKDNRCYEFNVAASNNGRSNTYNRSNIIPLNDRLFLSHCHVRGYKFIGPSTLHLDRTNEHVESNEEIRSISNNNTINNNFERHNGNNNTNFSNHNDIQAVTTTINNNEELINYLNEPKNDAMHGCQTEINESIITDNHNNNDCDDQRQIVALGGNALWATSLSLNFPFLFFPNNGLASMHFFANAGNLRYIDSCSALVDIYTWVRRCACSIGAGIVLIKIPLFGVSPSGRFELNASVPIGIDSNGSVTFRNGPGCLFDKVRFGLVWSSAYSF